MNYFLKNRSLDCRNIVLSSVPILQLDLVDLLIEIFPDLTRFRGTLLLSCSTLSGRLFWILVHSIVTTYQKKLATLPEKELLEHIKCLRVKYSGETDENH
jgi:hypothetical protein